MLTLASASNSEIQSPYRNSEYACGSTGEIRLSLDICLENGEWGVGSGEEGFSLFVVRETHGSLAPFLKP